MRGVHSAIALVAVLLSSVSHAADVVATPAQAAVPAPQAVLPLQPASQLPLPDAYGPFEVPAALRRRVQFWIDIYAKWNSWETVIGDVDRPELVYSFVDTRSRPKNAVAAEKAHVLQLLKRLASRHAEIMAGTINRAKLKAEERRLLEVFEAHQLLGEIPAAANGKRLRGQAGLRDGLVNAFFMSGRYLPRMEIVFEGFGLPPEIAYLPFVESGFNKRAVSKVGASGIWQFMPYTGKLYLRVDEEVDERNDPMRAAEAAARLMQQNYSMLGAWPLAVTAYNHGAMGMARAVRELGTKDLAVIIEKYESKSFGFASQNFYTSFLAALHVAKNSAFYLGELPRARKLEFDEFVMPHYMELNTLLDKMEIDLTIFRELNPALTPEVYSGRKYIPVGYTIRVPTEARGEFLSRYEAIPASMKFTAQKAAAAEVNSAAATPNQSLSLSGGLGPSSAGGAPAQRP